MNFVLSPSGEASGTMIKAQALVGMDKPLSERQNMVWLIVYNHLCAVRAKLCSDTWKET